MKKIISILTVLSCTLASISQAEVYEWKATYGSDQKHHHVQKVVTKPNGSEVTTLTTVGLHKPLIYQVNTGEGLRNQSDINPIGLIQSISQGGLSHTYQYNEHNWLVTNVSPELGKTHHTYYADGKKKSLQTENSSMVNFTYNKNGQLTKATYNASAEGTIPKADTINRTYDADNKLLTVNNGIAGYHYTYDVNSNLTSATYHYAGNDYVFNYTYDANNHLKSMTYPDGVAYEYTPNAYGQQTEVTRSDHGHQDNIIKNIQYSVFQGIQSYQMGNAFVENKQDSMGRITEVISGKGKPSNPSKKYVDFKYEYDGLNNVLSIEDLADKADNKYNNYYKCNYGKEQTISCNYDNHPVFTKNTLSQCPNEKNGLCRKEFSLKKDIFFIRGLYSTKISLPGLMDNQVEANFTLSSTSKDVVCLPSLPDKTELLTNAQNSSYKRLPFTSKHLVKNNKVFFTRCMPEYANLNLKLTVSYPKEYAGNIKANFINQCSKEEQKLLNGCYTLGRKICTQNSATKKINGIAVYQPCWQESEQYYCSPKVANTCPVQGEDCSYVSQKCSLEIGGKCIEGEKTYACGDKKYAMFNYDKANRLITANGPWGKGSYQYDNLNNITHYTLGETEQNYNYDKKNNLLTELIGTQQKTFTYDANGNVIGDGKLSYVYDAANQLIKVTGKNEQNESLEIDYQYDALGHVVSYQQTVNGKQQKPIFTIYDSNGNLLYLENPNKKEVKEYLYVSGKQVATVKHPINSIKTLTPEYSVINPLGSPIALIDDKGNQVWKREYQPYGKELKNQDHNINHTSFTGKRLYGEMDLIDMNARFYDPISGRFMGYDPAPVTPGNVFSFTRYAYANNNPYAYIDPTGMWSWGGAWHSVSSFGHAALGHAESFSAGAIEGFSTLERGYNKHYETAHVLGLFVGSFAGVGKVAAPAKALKNIAKTVTKKKLNKLGPVKEAEGAHTTWKSDSITGEITRHETWSPNKRNPSGWDKIQSTDLQGKAHINKITGEAVSTPHTQGKSIPGGVREAYPNEIPKRNYQGE